MSAQPEECSHDRTLCVWLDWFSERIPREVSYRGLLTRKSDFHMKSSSVIGSFFLLCFLAAHSGTLGRAAEPSPGGNVAYEVVPGWPRLPGAVELGPVSAVSVGSEGRVFVLYRGEGDPVLCFDREG